MKVFSALLRVTAGALALLVLGGCGANRSRTPVAGNPDAMPRFATHVFVGNCIFRESGAESALGATVLSGIISQTFNRIGSALAASAKEHTWTVTSTTNFEISSTDFPACVQIVRGLFYGDPSKATFAWAAGSPFEQHAEQLKRRGIVLGAKPDFFFEGVFRPASDNRAITAIVPVVTAFENPIAARALRSDSSRHVTLAFAFHGPGKAASDAANPGTDLVLGQLDPGGFTRYDQSCAPGKKPAASPSQPLPDQPGGVPLGDGPSSQPDGPPSVASSSLDSNTSPKIGARACPGESRWFGVERTDKLAPLSLTVAMSEMQGASAFLSFVADVFSDSKDELEKSTKEALISSEHEKARLAALQSQQEVSVAYDRALVEALEALDNCREDGKLSNVADARVNQQSANLAAHRAGRPPPFASLVQLTMTPDDAKAACGNAIAVFQ